jgi:hypothetical protein
VLNDASDNCGWYPMYMRVHRHLANITDGRLLKHSDNASDRESNSDTCTRGLTESDGFFSCRRAIS